MFKYILKRLLGMIPVLIIISLVLFIMTLIMPGDPINAYIGETSKLSQAQIAALRKNLGLDGPPVMRYLSWIKNMFTLNFGRSIQYGKPVSEVMGTFIWNSFRLNIVSMILAFGISIPVGIRSAVKKHKSFDNFWTVFSLVGVSMPSFFFGLVLIFIFSINLGLTPLNGMVTAGKKYIDFFAREKDIAYHMILPVTVLTMISLASYIKYVRNSMLEVINQDYIRTARAKGVAEKVVIYRHAFRNALIPVVTLFGFSVAGLFSGAALLETIFIWPGIGKVMVDAIGKRDMPILLTANLFFAMLALVGNLLSDIGYALVDPRIKVE